MFIGYQDENGKWVVLMKMTEEQYIEIAPRYHDPDENDENDDG